MAQEVIWEVYDNIGAGSQAHFTHRQDAVNFAMGAMKSVFTANPGSYWRIESWEVNGNARATVRSGPSANASIIADFSLYQRALTTS